MNSCLFGSRDSFEQSSYYYTPYSYPYPNNAPASYFRVNTPYSNGFYQYPTSQHPQLPCPYPYGNSNLSYSLSSVPSYPNTITSYPSTLPYAHNLSYNWGKPEVIIPSQGLETILIAILILVALDLLFVRSRR